MKRATCKYLNTGRTPLRVEFGTRPGHPPEVFEALPGEVVEGPAAEGYRNVFLGSGFIVFTPEIEAHFVKPALPVKADPEPSSDGDTSSAGVQPVAEAEEAPTGDELPTEADSPPVRKGHRGSKRNREV